MSVPSISEGYGDEAAEIEGVNLRVRYSEGEATVLASKLRALALHQRGVTTDAPSFSSRGV